MLTLSTMFAMSATMFSSCGDDDDDDIIDPTPQVDNTQKPKTTSMVFILNEGLMNKNNSCLDLYSPETKSLTAKIFTKANGEVIGDTGQDLIGYGGRLYLSVNGSKYFAKLDENGKLLEKYEFSEAEGDPRQVIANGQYVYVTLYSGNVARFDTTSLKNPTLVQVGANPEGMAIKGDQLLVCNSGWGSDNRLSVIDIPTFTLNRHVELVNNLQAVTVAGDSVYVTYYDANYAINTLNVDLSKDIFYSTANATKMAFHGDLLYCANSATEYDQYWNPTTHTTFYVKNPKTGIVVNNKFIEEQYAKELESATVYLFEIDPNNGNIYVGISDMQTDGTIYVFDIEGHFLNKFGTSGISPSHAVFF